MNPIQSIQSVFRNYINFRGRAQRSEFWWFLLFSAISQAVLNLIPFVGEIYGLAILLPSLAVWARRLHDINRTAWWLLLMLLPVIGWIVLLIWAIMPGTSGPNRYGPNPLQPQQDMGGYYQDPSNPYSPPTDVGGYALGSSTEPGGRIYCTQCGAEQQAEAQFCTTCGARL